MKKQTGLKKMKALLVHAGDLGLGGGQVQMNRLVRGLRARGVDARVICRWKTRDDSLELPRSDRLERWLGAVTRRCGLNDIHCVSAFKLVQSDAYRDADVIDFHCIHHGVFSYLALPTVTATKPAVFTLHDMWPFTGHCHTSLDCERWRHGCGRCPYPEVIPAIRRDGTRWEWKLKRWVYNRSRLVLVVPSLWLTRLARESMLSRFPIYHVPHGIDTSTYQPVDPDFCRAALGLPPGRRVLLAVAERFSRTLKGGDLLVEALRRLPLALKAKLSLLLFGGDPESVARQVDIPCVALGFVALDRLKVLAYSAADIFIHPTRADNFPLVVLESLACGTPVVSFRVGGVPELVRPGETGWLAEPEDVESLKEGIEALLSDDVALDRMRRTCRQTAMAEYQVDMQVARYMDVYQQAIRMHQALPAPPDTAPMSPPVQQYNERVGR